MPPTALASAGQRSHAGGADIWSFAPLATPSRGDPSASLPTRRLLFPRLPTNAAALTEDNRPSNILTSASQCNAPPVPVLGPSDKPDVTLVTQASADRLWMVPHICGRWRDAPMIVVSLSMPSARPDWRQTYGGSSCHLTRLQLSSNSDQGGEAAEAYPINWMRNQGILCVKTTHYFVVDIDFWPSTELLTGIRLQLTSWGNSRRALVVPNFQRSGHGCRNDKKVTACRDALEKGIIAMPTNFSELQACLTLNDCSVFDVEYNPQGQSSTNAKAWRAYEGYGSYRIPCIASDRYEPFVLLHRTTETPLFDERFQGYGKNKVQLTVHLRYAGFTFDVLARGFVIHFPHHKSASKHKWLHSSAHSRVEHLFTKFEEELRTQYNDTSNRVPICRHGWEQKRKGGTEVKWERSFLVTNEFYGNHKIE
ncbi:MAG: hypothetical protein SGPRY_000683 [Prymnesium sp.]